MQTLSHTNNMSNAFGTAGRELTSVELDEVNGGSYSGSLGTAVSLVVAGAAIAGAAPLIGGALILGSIGASGVAIFRSWHKLDKAS